MNHRILSHFLNITLILLGLTAANISLAETGGSVIEADNPLIRYSGRVDFSDPKAPAFDWPGISISARFTGTSCSIMLEDRFNEYNVYLDGVFQNVLAVKREQTVYPLVQGLGDGEHTILITKRTEASYGLARFKGFILSEGAKLVPLQAAPTRRIEFIGDSYTAGYGNEGPSPDCKNLRDHENNDLAYGPLTARALDAECHIIAISGYGMVRNYGDPLEESIKPLPYYYERTCQNNYNSACDFQRWQPQAVVVALGINDFSTLPHPSAKLYQGAYRDFIKKLRGYYPDAEIFCLRFPLIPESHVKEVVKACQKAGDAKVHYIVETYMPETNELGCDYHPRAVVHKRYAKTVTKAIKAVMGW